MQMAGALAGEHRDDRDDARRAVGRARAPRARHLGPQVVEGWHGAPFGKPLSWMREYVTIVRTIFAREKPLEFAGERYQIPYRGPGATGSASRSRASCTGGRTSRSTPAAIGPQEVALAAEIADGCCPVFYRPPAPAFSRPRSPRASPARAEPGKRERFDVAPMAAVVVGPSVDACRAH